MNKVTMFVYYPYIQADTWKYGWSYTPNTIHMNQCSPWRYSHETLFIPVLLIENTDIIHNIHTIHYPYHH